MILILILFIEACYKKEQTNKQLKITEALTRTELSTDYNLLTNLHLHSLIMLLDTF